MTYAVVARYECAPTDAPAVRAALLDMRDLSHQEPGNMAYVVHEVIDDDSTAFLLYEQYADEAGFQAHTRTEHFERLVVGTVRPVLTDRVVTFAEVI